MISTEDIALFTSGVRINLAYIYFKEGMKDVKATFEVIVREDERRNYFVAAGIRSIAEYVKTVKFNEEHLKFFKEFYKYSDDFIDYLRNYSFKGDIWAMPEGTIFFPNEPVIRITARIIDLCLMEQFVINTVMHQTMLASKFARIRISAKDKTIASSHVRSHGMESGIKSIRLSKMVGIDSSTMSFYSYKTGDQKTEGWGATHFFIQSFESELEAFRVYAKYRPEKSLFMLDTYDFEKGLENFIKVAKEVESENKQIRAVLLDSGDQLERSKYVRKKLDENNLGYIKIFAAGNYDEYKISKMIKENAPIDIFAVATEAVNSTDSPKLEVVFKMVEIEKGDKIFPKIKLSENKIHYPGKKQVYLIKSSNGNYVSRVIGLEGEMNQESLLIEIIREGSLVYEFPVLEETASYFKKQSAKYPSEIFNLTEKINFPIGISKKLQELFDETKATYVL